jgi:hypothetical protein
MVEYLHAGYVKAFVAGDLLGLFPVAYQDHLRQPGFFGVESRQHHFALVARGDCHGLGPSSSGGIQQL